jgi:hypothetical protein
MVNGEMACCLSAMQKDATGTKLPIQNVCYSVAIGGKADIKPA